MFIPTALACAHPTAFIYDASILMDLGYIWPWLTPITWIDVLICLVMSCIHIGGHLFHVLNSIFLDIHGFFLKVSENTSIPQQRSQTDKGA